MIFITIGLIVGFIMGITGAGGAIVAIPLFQILLGSSMKEATTLSLLTVLFGTLVNLLGNRSRVQWKVAMGFAFFGTLSNYISLPLKMIIPEFMIVVLLIVIGTYSLFSVWKAPRKIKSEGIKISIFKIALIGLFLGLVTTLTGLGGGVLLIPILLSVFGMTYEEALPTSLSTIFFISLTALIFQGAHTVKLISLSEMSFLLFGALIAWGILKVSLKLMDEELKNKLRKIVFTLATLASLIIVIVKTF